ncbi:MAG: DUF2905 domain-containing protein [Candidatus Omnitrophica bacterium]|nr:DUF2905 domain-containing protein [Candidatus Omnitrophota bacterium]
MQAIGKYLVILGIVLVMIGGIIFFAGKFSCVWKLPGDVFIKRGGFSFYFPISTCILVSVILSLVLYFISKK